MDDAINEDRYREQFREYLTDLQDALHLEEWDIALDWETALPDETHALLTVSRYARRARLTLGGGFPHLRPVTQRRLLVGKLLGCHTVGLEAAVGSITQSDAAGQLPGLSAAVREAVALVEEHLPHPPHGEGRLRLVPQAP